MASCALTTKFRIELGRHELAEPHDHGEQIVEVVRHAARQAPDGLHFLRLSELLFERVSLGEIRKSEDAATNQAGFENRTAGVRRDEAPPTGAQELSPS
jgi:hypothetical protein